MIPGKATSHTAIKLTLYSVAMSISAYAIGAGNIQDTPQISSEHKPENMSAMPLLPPADVHGMAPNVRDELDYKKQSAVVSDLHSSRTFS